MGKHSSPASGGRPAPFLLAPMLLVAAVVAALTIVARAGHAGQQIRTEPAPAATGPMTAAPIVPFAPAFPSSPAQTGGNQTGTHPMADRTSTTKATVRTSPSTAGPVTVRLLGAPDFAGYCAATGQGALRLVTDDAYGWRCASDNGTGDDAQAVCEWTFHSEKITNRVADFTDPDSWQCWRANRRLGSIDFAAYCRQTGHPGVSYLNGRYAYGWYCTGTAAGIDAQDACRRLFGTPSPVSRFQNFYDRNSWECWA
jgi:hypothetical protein